MDQARYKLLSTIAQALVQKHAPALYVDGKWGSTSQRTYDALDEAARDEVDSGLELLAPGVRVSDLSAWRRRVKRDAQTAIKLSTQSETVGRAISIAAAESGMSPEFLTKVFRIESGLNPKAVNGRSRGLGQIQPSAWDRAREALPDLPVYAQGVFDALQNARASAQYFKITRRDVMRLGYKGELTDAQLYMAYQQGPAGFLELWRASKGVLQIGGRSLVSARAMLMNVPSDKKGPTTDKKAFYDRWMAVLQTKLQ